MLPSLNILLYYRFIFVLLVAIFSVTISFGQQVSKPSSVKIGNQVWMGENLAVKKFSNGDPIPHTKTREEWIKAGENCTPAWTYYEHNDDFAKRVGILYNWYAVNDPRGLAPKGWRIPTVNDFSVLSNFLGGEQIAGRKLKSKQDWFRNGHGDNTSGFKAIGGGSRDLEGYFYYIVRVGFWWTIDELDDQNAWYYYIEFLDDALKSYGAGKPMGMSVRCIRE